jgi:hypothetical protein
VEKESVQQATLRRARDLAGGVTFLERKLGVGAQSLDAMIQGKVAVPNWIFIRAVDFINDTEGSKILPPGLPNDWQDPDTTKN